jgi:sarcosine oxidase, subunit beta
MSGAGGSGRPESPLPTRVNVLIVGGGIQGLSVAYNLAQLGERNVLVLDAGYFQGGASGRNGTLIRGGFVSDAWTALFALTNRRWIELSRRLRRNVMYSRRGYLMVAEQPATAERFDAALSTHRAHGVKSRRVTRSELASIAPALAADRVLDAIYLPEGGVAPHHAAMDGYLAACREAGVEIRYSTPVSHLVVAGSRVEGAMVGCPGSSREIRAACVVIAAGAQSVAVGRMAGVELSGFPMRIEAMALEPARNVLRPAVALIDRLCYLGQTARGEIVGGAEVPEQPTASLACDLPAMTATARAYRDMFPCFGQLRILRHWAGMIHATPDFGPLIGTHPSLENLWITAGWSYGFAAAPATGELLARAIHTGALDHRIAPFAVDRFERNAPVREAGIVLAPTS